MAVIGFVIGTAHDLLRQMTNFLNSHRSERESEVGRVDESPNVGQTGRSTSPADGFDEVSEAVFRLDKHCSGSTNLTQPSSTATAEGSEQNDVLCQSR